MRWNSSAVVVLGLALARCADGQAPGDASSGHLDVAVTAQDGDRDAGGFEFDAGQFDFDAGPDLPGDDAGGDCTDGDGDGYGEGPGCLAPDCVDTDPAINPGAAEVCNGRDDNCDGRIDEGVTAAQSVATTYTALQMLNGGCTTSNRYGGPCSSAVNRFCASRSCMTSGFGPVEANGDTAGVVCVRAEPTQTTSYTTLRTFIAGCDGTTERVGLRCNAAINRYCAAMGFRTGYGPVEGNGDTALVTCLRSAAAEVVNTTYTQLRMRIAGCDGTTQRWGLACAAAIHRFCAASGYVSGFGPVENNGDTAVVACVRR